MGRDGVRGVVTRWGDRHYGYIQAENGPVCFTHQDDIASDNVKSLVPGQRVEFDLEPSNKGRGWRACRVYVVSATPPEGGTTPARIRWERRNPFCPQNPMGDPMRFAGRKKPFIDALRFLRNGQNVLVTGKRAIGKTSLADQLLRVLEGDVTLLERLHQLPDNDTFRFVTADHSCKPEHSLEHIVAGLINRLSARLRYNRRIPPDLTQRALDSLHPVVVGAANTADDLSQRFVVELEAILDELGAYVNGVTFLIDEIDALNDNLELTRFIKASSEHLHRDNRKGISFLLTGVPGSFVSLVTAYASANRLLQAIELTRMNDEELGELIDLALMGSGSSITNEAKQELLRYANRYPHPVQLLGYHVFECDEDGEIGVADVKKGVESALQSLAAQYRDRYHKVAVRERTTILKVLAMAEPGDIRVSYIKNNLSQMGNDEIWRHLDLLERAAIIDRLNSSTIEFREPLFHMYLRQEFDHKTGG